MRHDEYKNIFLHQYTLWWYRGMGKILQELLMRYISTKKKLKILDAGCGTGVGYILLKPFGEVIGLDVSPEALKFARKIGEKVKKGSVMKLPFANKSFDLVMSLDVLYHEWVSDYNLALKEYIRVLKPGGILLWREPAYDWLKSGHDMVDLTERRFTNQKMSDSFLGLPVKILKISYLNFFLFPLVILKRLPDILKIEKSQAESDIKFISPWLNNLLTYILKLESKLITYISFPYGSSVICIVRKQKEK